MIDEFNELDELDEYTSCEVTRYAAVRRTIKQITDMKTSERATLTLQSFINIMTIAIIKSAHMSAVFNNRKTISDKDMKTALESLRFYEEAWDCIYKQQLNE